MVLNLQDSIFFCLLTFVFPNPQEATFALQMKMLPCLAFVPEDRVEEAFEALEEFYDSLEDEDEAKVKVVMNYMEDNYIGRHTRRGTRRAPRYKKSLWNCSDLVRGKIEKTTNRVEGWHRGLESTVGMAHPNPFKLINTLKRVQVLNSVVIEQLIAIKQEVPSPLQQTTELGHEV